MMISGNLHLILGTLIKFLTIDPISAILSLTMEQEINKGEITWTLGH